jgi:vacuolar-type H+-ATPase subunit H
MKLLDIKNYYKLLDGIPKNLPIKFLIIIEENKQILSSFYNIIKNLEDSILLEKAKPIEEEKGKIIQHYAKKNEDGSFVNNNNNFVFDNIDIPKIEKELKELEENNVDLLKEQRKRNEEFEKYLEKEVDINIIKIGLDDFPDELVDKIEELSFLID